MGGFLALVENVGAYQKTCENEDKTHELINMTFLWTVNNKLGKSI